ncbi:MAG: HD domain-containing protein [Aigarchaeota archaeon]|nr:HD domain-containing protein [Candidatus Pelearchaeum maunauluense]
MKVKLIKDPIHGYIELNEHEVRIIDTAAFQRLRRIIQLPLAYLVYPGARHSRFDHSLGSFHLAKEFATHLGLEEYRRRVLTVAALLHDIGHTPYSHLLEAILLENSMTHEDMSIRLIKEETELASAIESYDIRIRDVVDVLEKRLPESAVIIGPMDVDKMDFLVRDSYFTGAMYGMIDTRRIIRLSAFVEGRLAVNIRGLGAIEEMAIARLQSFLNIYFHHATRGAQQLLLNAARQLSEELDFPRMTVEEYLEHDDISVWSLLKRNEKTRGVIKRLERRILPKRVYETRLIGGKTPARLLSDKELQHSIATSIASRAGLRRELVWIDTPYVPPLPMEEPSAVIFFSEDDGERRIVNVSSPFLQQVSEIYNIVRVYTDSHEREKVARAAAEIFGQPQL